MRQSPVWLKILIVILLVIAVLLPLVILALKNPKIATQLPTNLRLQGKTAVSPRYSVKNTVPGYALSLVDTQYLDYAIEKLGVFGSQAIVDPMVYRGSPKSVRRYTVSHVRFELVPMVDPAIFMAPGKKDFSGRGNYLVEGDTLIVLVSLDFVNLTRELTGKFALEDSFLNTALPVIYYSRGLLKQSDTRAIVEAISAIKQDIQQYLYDGIFIWPIQIVSVK